MKIKIDSQIKTLVENGVKKNERSMFIVVGDRGRDRVADFFMMLSKARINSRPSVLWCYNKELGFSSHKKKRLRQIKRAQQRGSWDPDVDDPFELFISTSEIRFAYYKDSHKILGNTYGMLVLQDFESLTPNLLCRTIETVEGGGVVVFLLKSMSSLKQLYTLTMDVHHKFTTPAYSSLEPRFNERFILSLTVCRNCLVLDDEFNLLKVTETQVEPASEELSSEQAELTNLKQSLAGTEPVGSLVGLAKTLDQGNVIMQVVGGLLDGGNVTYGVTAARGRGKSAALGLAVAGSVELGYSSISVTAPSPENLNAFFQFVLVGLRALGYQEHTHFTVQRGAKKFTRSILKIDVFKNHKQTIQYVLVNKKPQCDLLVIDEAAAIPLPFVKEMLGSYPVLISSTIHGYEGTGRALSLKLFSNLQTRNFKHLKMNSPIRYANKDPIEKWLTDLLCLEATQPYSLNTAPPHPSQCSLYLLNRDTLFSFHRASELFLHRLMSLFVSSHYKNTPNDLQLMSDAPAHNLFVLLGPLGSEGLPDILCAVQVCYEGKINRERVKTQLAKGHSGSGDMIPWMVSEHFQDPSFGELTGVRVVRIATHPDAQNMGYGSKALEELKRFFKGELFFEEPEDLTQSKEETEEIRPRAKKPLLRKLSQVKPPEVDYLGVAFGINTSLYKFWERAGFTTVYIKQKASQVTGEYSSIMLHSLFQLNFESYYQDFRKRFLTLLSFEFRQLPSSLALSILGPQQGTDISAESLQNYISLYDLKRLQAFSRKLVDYHLILDLLPALASLYFGSCLNISVSKLHLQILVAVALQRKDFESLPREFELPSTQMVLLFNKVFKVFTQHLQKIYEADVEQSLPLKRYQDQEEPTHKQTKVEDN